MFNAFALIMSSVIGVRSFRQCKDLYMSFKRAHFSFLFCCLFLQFIESILEFLIYVCNFCNKLSTGMKTKKKIVSIWYFIGIRLEDFNYYPP